MRLNAGRATNKRPKSLESVVASWKRNWPTTSRRKRNCVNGWRLHKINCKFCGRAQTLFRQDLKHASKNSKLRRLKRNRMSRSLPNRSDKKQSAEKVPKSRRTTLVNGAAN